MIDHGLSVKLEPLDSYLKEIIRDWRNDPEIFQWCRQNTLISDAEQERWFENQSRDPKIQMFSITARTKDGLQPVGVCGFTDIDHFNRRAEFSLYIAREHHGRGFGKGALMTLFNHGFIDLGFNVIWGETFDNNPAAKMFEDIGMKKEGVRRDFYFKKGKFINAALYSILRSEWHS